MSFATSGQPPQTTTTDGLGLRNLLGDSPFALEALLVGLERGVAARLHTGAGGVSDLSRWWRMCNDGGMRGKAQGVWGASEMCAR
jgi:hypothetical protein